MGYKFAFKNNDGTYKNNTSFEDIYSLYIFDKMLKLIILDPILEIEQKLKTIYTNNYSSRYGFKINDILNSNNYDLTNNYLNDTLSNLDKQLNDFGNKNKAVMFYRNNYSFIPLWVYMKILSFGMIRDMFYVSKTSDKDYMKNKLTKEKININETANMLRLLVRVRNICCHDDILLSFVDDKLGIKTTKYHNFFNLKKDKNNNIIQGKKDLFAILISIKFFSSKERFNILINNLSNLINEYDEQFNSLNKNQLLSIMHLPEDFEKLKDM
jgi:abortive infection bacteriophage resistance protein